MCIGLAADASAQTPARAAKRRLQRERRRVGRADGTGSANASSKADAGAVNGTVDAHASDSVRAAVPPTRAEALTIQKVSVRHTFVDFACEESEGSCDIEANLPAADFETTASFEEFRRAYRMFRLGFHRGAKGEASSPRSDVAWLDLRPLDIPQSGSATPEESRSESSTQSACGSNVPASPDSASPPESDDGSAGRCDGPSESKRQTAARALKRQRQRERRRFYKGHAGEDQDSPTGPVTNTSSAERADAPPEFQAGCAYSLTHMQLQNERFDWYTASVAA